MRPKLSRVSNGGELRRRPDGRSRERARELRMCGALRGGGRSSPSIQPALWSLEWWRGRAGDGTNARGGKVASVSGRGCHSPLQPSIGSS